MCNLINIHTHTHTKSCRNGILSSVFVGFYLLLGFGFYRGVVFLLFWGGGREVVTHIVQFLLLFLSQMVDVKREVAVATRPELGGAGGGGAYDGCLDRFERGMSAARLREVFDELKNALVPLLRDIQAKVER